MDCAYLELWLSNMALSFRPVSLCKYAAELRAIISRYSKQTDRPSLKHSLEASDEMAQIMSRIINHRQGAAALVCVPSPTHTWARDHYGAFSTAPEQISPTVCKHTVLT